MSEDRALDMLAAAAPVAERVLSSDEQNEIRIQYLAIQLLQSQMRELDGQHQNAKMTLEITQRRAQDVQSQLTTAGVKLKEFRDGLNVKYGIKPDEQVDDNGRIVPKVAG